jgi:large subunit ribosomal protein L4
MTPEPASTATDRTSRASTAALDVELPAEIFDVQVNIPLIHQVVVAQQAAARQGTHSTRTRGEVRGGGRKPYKQKGTGRARQGSTRAPQFAGGGTVHGPHPRGYEQRTPKKMKAAALRGALSDRARAGRVLVVDSLLTGDTPSTKAAVAGLAAVTSARRVLVVLERGDNLTWLSLRNVPTVHLLAVDQLNTYDVLLCDDVVFTRGAYDTFVGGARTGAAPASADTGAGTGADTGAGTGADTGAGTGTEAADDSEASEATDATGATGQTEPRAEAAGVTPDDRTAEPPKAVATSTEILNEEAER